MNPRRGITEEAFKIMQATRTLDAAREVFLEADRKFDALILSIGETNAIAEFGDEWEASRNKFWAAEAALAKIA